MDAQPSYVYLGNTGLKVSSLCMGTMNFSIAGGAPFGFNVIDEKKSFEILDYYASTGGNFIDTANMYNKGESEEVVGKWLKSKNRDDFVIATKVRWNMAMGPNNEGLSRKHLCSALKASLQRLQTDYIDLYYIHAWDSGTPLLETLSTINDFVRQGKIRYYGLSNYSGWQLQKAISLCEQHGFEKPCCIQQQYSLMAREAEWEIVPCALDNGISILPWSPLKGGWLSGKYTKGTPPPSDARLVQSDMCGWLPTSYEHNNNEHTWNLLARLKSIAESIEAPMSSVALRWLMDRPAVGSVVIGASSVEQLEENMLADHVRLSPDDNLNLGAASSCMIPYPYDIQILHGSKRDRP